MGDAYYWILSSIFQGLFAMLGLGGVFIVFKIDYLTKFIWKFHKDIEENLVMLRSRFLGDNEYDELVTNLDKREVEDFLERINKHRREGTLLYPEGHPTDNLDQIRAFNDSVNKICLIGCCKKDRDRIIKSLILPYGFGITATVLSLIFLGYYNLKSVLPSIINQEVIAWFLIILSCLSILLLSNTVYLSFWDSYPNKKTWKHPLCTQKVSPPKKKK